MKTGRKSLSGRGIAGAKILRQEQENRKEASWGA